jgi:aminoglycoside 6'-N-acetyltransferase
MCSRFEFAPLTRGDFPLLARWLQAPHISAVVGHGGDLDELEAHYGPEIDGIDPTEDFIVSLDDQPIGHVQRYLLEDYPDWRHALGIARGAGIDYLIGDPSLTGRGFGVEMIQEFARLTFRRYPNADLIASVPQQANRPSWRVLEKAGFERVFSGVLNSDDPSDAGPSFVYVLRASRGDSGTDGRTTGVRP